VKILNQMTETHRVRDLAKIVSGMTGAEIDFVTNPRNEAAENDLFVENKQFLDLGLEPVTLEDSLLKEITEIAEKYSHRCDRAKIPCQSLWR
jgi:UDP-sulfoquinovose synthase